MYKLYISIIIFIYNMLRIRRNKKELEKVLPKSRLKLPKKIKIFNLGSSHGYFSFNYDNLENAVNFSYPSQTLYYDYKIIKNYYDSLEENGICFVVLSYFSFTNKKFFVKEDIYSKTLKIKYLDKEDKIDGIIFQYFPILNFIRKFFVKVKKRKLKEGNARIEKHVEMLEKQDEKFGIMILEKIIKELKEKNIRVILITTPFQREYNDSFSQELLENNFYSIVSMIKNKYNLTYYDFSHRYDLFGKNDLFSDFDHLNEKGSKIFMKEIEEILKIYYKLDNKKI